MYEQLNALISFLSGLVAGYEKPKNGGTKTLKKNTKKDLLEENQEENTYEYVKLHETSKNDPILLITKRRAAILKEILKKMIETTGSQSEIKYKSSYSGTEDILNLDLAAIEFKIHGNNQKIKFSRFRDGSHVCIRFTYFIGIFPHVIIIMFQTSCAWE